MNNLEEAKELLRHVGGKINSKIKQKGGDPFLQSLLADLKEVNSSLKRAIEDSSIQDFSFDDEPSEMTESVQRPQRRMTEESEMDFGVDLGGFNNFINQKSPEQEAGYNWKQTFREANSGECGGVDVGGFNPNAEVYSDTLGRIIDET